MPETPIAPPPAEVQAPIVEVPTTPASAPAESGLSPGFTNLAEGLNTGTVDVDSAFHDLAEGKVSGKGPEDTSRISSDQSNDETNEGSPNPDLAQLRAAILDEKSDGGSDIHTPDQTSTQLTPDGQVDLNAMRDQVLAEKRPFMEPPEPGRVDAVKMMPVEENGKTISDVIDTEAGLTKNNQLTTETPTLDATENNNPIGADAPTGEATTSEAGTNTEPHGEGETGENVRTPEQEAAEQRKQLLETGGELAKLGIDPNTPEGADVFKLVAENPDQMDAVRATSGALSEVGKLSDKLGVPGAGPKAILEALTSITSTLEAQIAEASQEEAKDVEDPAKTTEAESKSKLLKILKALVKAVFTVVKVAANGVALAAGAAKK